VDDDIELHISTHPSARIRVTRFVERLRPCTHHKGGGVGTHQRVCLGARHALPPLLLQFRPLRPLREQLRASGKNRVPAFQISLEQDALTAKPGLSDSAQHSRLASATVLYAAVDLGFDLPYPTHQR